MNMISLAYAVEPAKTPPSDPMSSIMMWVWLGFIVVMFYLLFWRPQQKSMKEHKTLISSLQKGDEIVVNGGILGRITKITDDFIMVEIANNVEIKVQKSAVTASLPKGTLKSI